MHLRRVKQNIVAPARQGSKLYAATPRSDSISRRRSSGFTTWNAPWRSIHRHYHFFVRQNRPKRSLKPLISCTNTQPYQVSQNTKYYSTKIPI